MPLVSSIIPPVHGQSKAIFLPYIHKLQQRSCYTFSKPCILYSIVIGKRYIILEIQDMMKWQTTIKLKEKEYHIILQVRA